MEQAGCWSHERLCGKTDERFAFKTDGWVYRLWLQIAAGAAVHNDHWVCGDVHLLVPTPGNINTYIWISIHIYAPSNPPMPPPVLGLFGDICIPWSRYVVSNMATLVSNLNVKGKEFQSQLDRYVEYLLWTINAPSFDHCFWVYFLTLIFTG